MSANNFRIESGKPIPPHGGGIRRLYPWDKLEVGQSVTFPDRKLFHLAQASASHYGRKYGRKYIGRVAVLTIWRIS